MQTSYKRVSVVAGFALLSAVLIANALITRHRLAIQVRNQDRVAQTRMVLLELGATESLLKDAETGQRGYLYTGQPRYLEPYNDAIVKLRPSLQRLLKLTAGEAQQQARVMELGRLSQEKLGELAATLKLFDQGKRDEAKSLVMTDAGLDTMNKIRRLVVEMQDEETASEVSRTDAYQRSTRLTIVCIYLASGIAVAGLALLALYIQRENDLREKHAAQLRAREEWFRVTLTSVGEAVIATDAQGRVTFLNPLAERLTGVKLREAQNSKVEDVFAIFNEFTNEPVENPVKKVLELGKVVGLANHTVLIGKDGKSTAIEDSAAPIWNDNDELIGVVLVFRDASEVRKAQEILRRTEKLAAAARLSATMAHEINNPLEAIGNLLYIAKSTPGAPLEVVRHLLTAEEELARVSHITRQTLGFYRESNALDWIEVDGLVESVITLYSNKLRAKNISVIKEYGVCPPLHGRAGELKQAISNLISNAADAVSEKGTIWIKLFCSEGEGTNLLHISIGDDGPGIEEAHVCHIFEPFFTTKKDVGTGLGLWVTKEIVDRHGGTIEVAVREPEVSRGAIFRVIIPVNTEVQIGPETAASRLDA